MNVPEQKLPQKRQPRRPRWLLVLGILAGCSGPFFPVPPPEDTSFTAEALTDASGETHTYWRAHRGPDAQAANAEFFLQHVPRKVTLSSFAGPDGAYDSPAFEGQEGDRVNLHFRQTSGESSQSACLLLRVGAGQRCPD